MYYQQFMTMESCKFVNPAVLAKLRDDEFVSYGAAEHLCAVVLYLWFAGNKIICAAGLLLIHMPVNLQGRSAGTPHVCKHGCGKALASAARAGAAAVRNEVLLVDLEAEGLQSHHHEGPGRNTALRAFAAKGGSEVGGKLDGHFFSRGLGRD